MDNGRQAEGAVVVMHRRYAGGLIEIRRPVARYRGSIERIELDAESNLTVCCSWLGRGIVPAGQREVEWEPQADTNVTLAMFLLLVVHISRRVTSTASPFAGHYRVTLYPPGVGFDGAGDSFGNF